MLSHVDPRILIAVGVVLMLLGVILPYLMIMRVLESTFFLDFFSFIASFLGVLLGITGIVFSTMRGRKRDR